MKGIYQVRSYDGNVTRDFRYYKRAYAFAVKLIRDNIPCGIWQLVIELDADGTDNLDTLRWVQVIGC